MILRANKIQNALAEAANKAKLSPDAETQVGCVLIDNDGATLLSSYNGYVRKAPDSTLPNTRPDKYTYILHAEHNLLLTAARKGIAVNEHNIVITHSPCSACMRMLWQAGINKIFCSTLHHSFRQDLEDLNVKLSGCLDFYQICLFAKT